MRRTTEHPSLSPPPKSEAERSGDSGGAVDGAGAAVEDGQVVDQHGDDCAEGDPLEGDAAEELPARREEPPVRALVDLLLDVGEQIGRGRLLEAPQRAQRPLERHQLRAALDADRQVLLDLRALDLGERPVDEVGEFVLCVGVVHGYLVCLSSSSLIAMRAR